MGSPVYTKNNIEKVYPKFY